MELTAKVPSEVQSFIINADYIDHKTAEGDISLRQLAAGLLGYQPDWETFLYRVRGVFVRFLGMKQGEIPRPTALDPAKIRFEPGGKMAFFDVWAGEEDRYLILGIKDKHLSAALFFLREPSERGGSRFHVTTIVQYNNWAGPVYFAFIRPFHHIILNTRIRAALRKARRPSISTTQSA